MLMVLNWLRGRKSIEQECAEFRKEERDKIWEKLCLENQQYKQINFEELAYREPDKTEKALFTFDKSCERVVNGGKRHALPAEVFSLIIDVLEGKVSGALVSVKDDMFKSYGEWFDLVIKPENNTLHCYEHPRNVIPITGDYDCSKMTFSNEKQFPLNGLPLKTYIPIKDIAKKSPQMIIYVWSRPFEKLPSEIQKNAGLWIPDHAQPVGRGYYGYYVIAYYYVGASRGVVVEQKIFNENKD